MEFSEVLGGYVSAAGCTAAELAGACGMTPSTVSRYLSGARRPSAASLPAADMARALAELAARNGSALDEDEVRANLLACARPSTPSEAGRKVALLLRTFGITRAKLAEELGYSPSHVSRLTSGTRTPADFEALAGGTGAFFARQAEASGMVDVLERLCADAGEAAAGTSLAERVAAWLCAPEAREEGAHAGAELEPFLRKLDAFDLDRYVAALKVSAQAHGAAAARTAPTDPLTCYEGVQGFCNAELDFLACACTEPAGSRVVLFSDMPMQDKMDVVPEFPVQWVAALAALVQGGHVIENVHDVGRTLPEMMLGLEAWLPLYMTGMVRPRYLPSHRPGTLRHLVRCSETAALEGQAVAGAYEHVGCQLFRSPEALSHFRTRAEDLLARTKPLADIFLARDARAFHTLLEAQATVGGTLTQVLSAPPLFTMDEALLADAVRTAGLTEEEVTRVRAAWEAQRRRVGEELARGEIGCTVARVAPETFAQAAPRLALGEAFCEHDAPYSPEVYARHLELTERFAAEHPAWHLAWGPDLGFRNIQIAVRPGAWALVSKSTSPAIHFVLRHAQVVRAFERMELPVVG